jgi:thioredoxin reductase
VFDVAIIGGGFSGLSAALLLGRYLRQIVIFDVNDHGYKEEEIMTPEMQQNIKSHIKRS